MAERYDKVFYQRNREDIINELKELAGDTKGGHDVYHSKNHDGLGEEYGLLSGRSVARLLRVNELVPELKKKLDAGKLNLVAAVQLSYVPEDVQRAVAELDRPISKDMAVKIRKDGKIIHLSEKTSWKAIRISMKLYQKYFDGLRPEQVQKIVERALEDWFEKGKKT